ncbi:MAG: M23 family metallopeptidase [Dechloromonas sp.]|nr:MAG: M23 family metallopeptidase [Dechloromonas sp.]
MTSILDHHMEKAYDEDGIVTAFTGEEGRATAAKPKVNQGCYPQYSPNPGKPFVIKGLYIGTNDGCLADQGLNYDNHPAYDYVAETGTPVYAAASGRVVKIINKATGLPGRCVPKGIETGGCGIWCYVGIDHGNGYVTQYGHLSRIDVQSGDEIKAGALIGLTGQCSPPTKDKNGNVTKLYSVPPHFHFEVLKENAGSPYGYAFVDPYGWEGDPRNDPLEKATGIPNVRLWKTGVQANPADAKMPSKSNADVISRTMEATAIPTISAEKEAQQVGYAHLEKMLTKCNGLSYLKSRHLGNDRKEITDIREYKGTLRIVCHERPESNPAKGIEWSCAFEVNAPRERMNYHNEGWVTETHMPLMFGVTKAHGRWQADSSFQKVTCDEVQGSLANQVLQGIRNIDFRNFTYDLAPWCGKEFGKTRVRIKDGGYGSQTDWWFGIWEMPGYASIIYGDLTGDGRDEAIVTTSCGGCMPPKNRLYSP